MFERERQNNFQYVKNIEIWGLFVLKPFFFRQSLANKKISLSRILQRTVTPS